MSSVIGRIYIYINIYIYNGSVIQCWRSCTPSRSIGLYFWWVRGSWAECHFLFSLVYQLCLAIWYKSNTRMLVTFGICFKQHFDTRYLVYTIPYLPGCFCPWTFFENIGFNTGFATGCPCGVWCRGLTTCLPHVGAPFGNRFFLKNGWVVDLT